MKLTCGNSQLESGQAAATACVNCKSAKRHLRTIHRTRALWIVLAWVCSVFHANAAPLQVLKGHVPKAARNPIGSVDASKRLDLAIGLPLRNSDQLTNLLRQIYESGSTNFHRYLTPEQFTAAFGPTEKDYQSVMDFARAHSLSVTGTHPNRTLLDVNGAVADIEKAFHVNLRLYQHPTENRTFFAPDAEPSVELDTPLLAISGLDDFVKPHPLLRHSKKSPTQTAHPMDGSGGGGTYLGKDFRAAYLPGVSLTGAGQTIGLFELDGYVASDITTYESEAGETITSLTHVLIDGFNGSASLEDGDDEVALDIDMAFSMAPGAAIIVYEGPPPPLAENTTTAPSTTTHVNDVLNRMASDNKARQLSCSWGFDINASTQQIFEQYAAQGQSFFLACGDSGAFVGAVPEPADDPYITVVGGTELTTTGPGGSWVSETTWNSGSSLFGEEGTGGGISMVYPIPSYQQGVSMTANQGSTTMRNVPDVAMVADNVWVIANGQGSDVGGTSVAAPLWAGVAALANQQAAASGRPAVGFANPALYAIGTSTGYASSFHDITTGNNTTTQSPNQFYAVAGYDLCTGWGTPNGNSLIQQLLAPPVKSLVISDPFGFTASGPIGGPFNVTSQTYILTNIGSAPLNWSLVNTSAWLTVSSTGGALNPGGPAATVTVSLNAAASNSLIESFSGNVVISNVTDGVSQNRAFNLLVGNGGFETGDFTDWTLVGNTNDNFALGSDDTTIDGIEAITGVNDWTLVHSGLYGALLGQVGSVATLSQTIPTVPGRSYLLSFWLTSVPLKGSTTPNSFSVSWGGDSLLDETDVGVFGWTNYQFTISATASSTVLQFGDREDPAAFGLDDVTVQAIVTNTPPVITPVSNQFVNVNRELAVTNFASSADEPVSFALGSNAPAGVAITTGGVLTWTPACEQGSSTNLITVWAIDSSNPALSNSMTFTVTVGDCVELSVGSTVVQAGQSACVPLSLVSSVPLTNLSFSLAYSNAFLTNWSITASNPAVAAATAQTVAPSMIQFNLTAQAGQSLQGATGLGSICVDTLLQPSAFVPLILTNISALELDGSSPTNIFPENGRLAIVGSQPLLELLPNTNSIPALAIYANSGTYEVLSTTNLTEGTNWNVVGTFTLTAPADMINVGSPTNQAEFFKVIQVPD